MWGGFVACLGPGQTAARVESAASHLKWHRGEVACHRHGALHVACLASELHGPNVEVGAGRLLLCHGASARPLEALKRSDRFAALESDGASLRAIRDPMGEVPLFYRRAGDELWLATEIHPLLAIAESEPDLEWLAAFAAMVEDPAGTGWSGVRRAMPGEILNVDPGLRITSERYFPPRVGVGRRGVSAVAARGFRELFLNAVAKRSSARCGVLLSGGLDSSAVAVAAARTVRPALLTISHPRVAEIDEIKYAQAIADTLGVRLATLEVEPDAWDPADDIRIFGLPPQGVPTGIYVHGLGALAAAGCDLALDGQDGDGALGNPYAWCANTLLDARVDRLAHAAGEHGLVFVLRQLGRDFVPPSVWNRMGRWPPPPDHRASFLPYFRGATRSRLAEESRWRPPRSGWEHAQLQALLPPATQLFEEIELYGARSGIDIQHPFADRELVSFLIALPHVMKASSHRLKPLLRGAFADLLPQVVVDRDDKTDFAALIDARVDFHECFRTVRDSGVRLPDLDYDRLFRDAARPVNDRLFWMRLARAHVFASGTWS